MGLYKAEVQKLAPKIAKMGSMLNLFRCDSGSEIKLIRVIQQLTF